MFIIDQDITVPKLREKNLVKVFFSMNNHHVATPEMMLEEARSYVMFYGEPGGKVSAYIGLYLILTGRRLFYAHSTNPFPQAETGSVEDEALCFVEGLGALVDQIDIANLSSEQRGRWIEEQDIFSLQARTVKPSETPAPEPEETEAVRTEPQALQPSPAVPEVAPQPQRPVQPEPRAEPVRPAPEAAPAAPEPQPVPQTQAAPQPAPQAQPAQEVSQPRQAPQVDMLPQAATAATQQPASLTEKAPTGREEESTPRPSAPQPNFEPEEEYQEQAVPSPADVPESRNAPATQQTSGETSHREAPERTRPKPAARATGSKAASSAASSMGKQDIMRKAIKAGVVVKPQKPSIKDSEDAVVVRRDREALARLLTSF